MALTQLNQLLSYDEWKEQSPVNHRGLAILPDDDLELRFGYNDYVNKSYETGLESGKWQPFSPEENKYLKQKQYEFVSKHPSITSPESYIDALNKNYEVKYEEKLGKLLAGDKYKTLPTFDGDYRSRLNEFGFDPVEYLRVFNKRAESGEAELTSSEQATLDTHTPELERYVDAAWPTFSREALANGDAGIITTTNEKGQTYFLSRDDIPQEERQRVVDQSVAQGFIKPFNRKDALLWLDSEDKKSGVPAATRSNYTRALIDIGALADVNPEFSKELNRMIREIISVTHRALPTDKYTPQEIAVPEFVVERVGVSALEGLSVTDRLLLEEEDPTQEIATKPFTKPVRVKPDDPEAYEFPGVFEDHSYDYSKLLDTFNAAYEGQQFYSDEVKLRALQYIATHGAFSSGGAKFTFDKDVDLKRTKNTVSAGYGDEILHGNLFLSNKDFSHLLKTKPKGYTEEGLKKARDAYFINNEVRIDEILSESDLRSDWITYSTGGGSKNPDGTEKKYFEKLRDFIDTTDGSVAGKLLRRRLGRELLYASGDLAGLGAVLVGSMFSDDLRHLGTEMLAVSAEERDMAVRAKALYGEEFTFWDNTLAMAMPLTVDLLATGVLATVSGGTLTTAYASGALQKYGYKTTAKGFLLGNIKGGINHTLQQAVKKGTVDDALQQLYVRGYIKSLPSLRKLSKADLDKLIGPLPKGARQKILKDAGVKGTVLPKRYYRSIADDGLKKTSPNVGLWKKQRSQAALDAYNAIAKGQQKFLYRAAIQTSMFVPAFNRSASSAYGNIYHLLKDATGADGKQLTEEERHERAFIGGLISGAVTGATVVGLNKFGFGLEKYAAGGATVKDFRKLFESLRNKPYLGIPQFAKDVAKKFVDDGYSGLTGIAGFLRGPVFKATLGEAGQEGLDAFLNSFTRTFSLRNTSANESRLPFYKRLEEGMLGAAHGAVLGGSVATGGKGVSALRSRFKSPEERADERGRGLNEARLKVAKDLRSKIVQALKDSGSTETAQTLEEILVTMAVAELSPPESRVTPSRKDSVPKPDVEKPGAPPKPLTEAETETASLQDELVALMEIDPTKLTDEQKKRIEEINAELDTPPAPEADEDLVEQALNMMGFTSADIAEHLDVVRDPSKASAVQKSNAIGALERLAKSAPETTDEEVLKNRETALRVLVEQIRRGSKSEEEASASLEDALKDPEKVAAAIAEINALANALKLNKSSSGAGESTVTPDEKTELVDQFARLARGRGLSPGLNLPRSLKLSSAHLRV